MIRKKYLKKLKRLTPVVLIATGVAAFLFLHKAQQQQMPSQQTADARYETKDRLKLEQLIHEETKND
jgi:hypothetical protein